MKQIILQTLVPAFLLLFLADCSTRKDLLTIQSGSPEKMVKHLYNAVSVEAGKNYDWDEVRSFFIKDPIIVLRTSKEESTVFTMEGFVNDFKSFVERAKIIESGFKEEIIEMRSITIGDISNIIVVYEASIPGSGKLPQRGIDIIHLINTDDGWKISSIVNEIPDPSKSLNLDLSNVDL
ncbi:hypothetical protein ACFLU5_02120 [Bacteroidota bacterium]